MKTNVQATSLPPEVTDPIIALGAQLIGLAGYFALGAIFALVIRGCARYYDGAGFADLWPELLIIGLCAACAAKTFDIATWLN